MDQDMRRHPLEHRAGESPAQAVAVHQRHIALPFQQGRLQARQVGFQEGDLDSRMLAFEGLKNCREA